MLMVFWLRGLVLEVWYMFIRVLRMLGLWRIFFDGVVLVILKFWYIMGWFCMFLFMLGFLIMMGMLCFLRMFLFLILESFRIWGDCRVLVDRMILRLVDICFFLLFLVKILILVVIGLFFVVLKIIFFIKVLVRIIKLDCFVIFGL